MTRTLEWRIAMDLVEDGDTTEARAVLDTGRSTITGRGSARRNPEDEDVPLIGDELAASRAMSDLARQLMRLAYRDIGEAGAGMSGEADRDTPYGWSTPVR
ncbi:MULTISPECIES: DUF1876 domain-containing protein [Streptomyces]|uniref:DUF1876 domain-containing protein n=1 Tax=Streptomyces sudanensis TaxID=436397 RepID=A0ABY4THH2_9ACTN|nr:MULTISPECIES: DUF1876 domain-containing protein [Streptomyces]MCP9960021.1 DUF1876 domain-containing protein [Streptomyces sudanensis]MCP9989037.1 DUF1876 domain-containing protein [Streptomyces sudanensis]MCP9999579.1 DUF1876 domain-containing protein [Streptomyces sudanensis]URN18348.1 DUF1876 domain-containing protein [Streptomyces sudanensis]